MNDPSPIDALDALGALGSFFALDRHPVHASPDGPWQPLSRLLEPAGIRERIHQVRDALARSARCEVAGVPWRVAVSVAHLGLVARLVSPAVGALALEIGTLSLDPAATWWQPVVGGPVPLSVAGDALVRSTADDAGPVIEGVVRTLTMRCARESVSPLVLWGNVASAVNGAYSVLASTRPDLSAAAQRHTLGTLRLPALAGMSNSRPGPDFRRINCCLIYRLSGAREPAARQVCGDCVLRTADAG